MGSSYRFISTIEETEQILNWFRSLQRKPVEQSTDRGVVFYFKELGPLTADLSSCPVVSIFLPRIHRGILTTVGEVHFLPTPMNQFPELVTISRRFSRSLSRFTLVHSYKRPNETQYSYYLEGGLLNIDTDIYALPAGLIRLQEGHYFISDEAALGSCEQLCQKLWLRGVEGIE